MALLFASVSSQVLIENKGIAGQTSAELLLRIEPDVISENPDLVIVMVGTNDVGFLDIHQSFRDLGLPQHNSDKYIQNEYNSGRRDGVHPTGLGCSFISEQTFAYLEEKKMLKKGMRIICFGDSLTRGSNVEGAGTVTGSSYPACLSIMISNKYTCNNEAL